MSSTSPTDAGTAPIPTAASLNRWRGVLTRSAFVAAALLTLIVGFYMVEKQRGIAAWQAYQAEARAREVKLLLAEYIPPPVPDESNFAAIPLFQDAFKTPTPPNPLEWPATRGVKLPTMSNFSQGQPVDLGAWQKFFVEARMLSSANDNAATGVLEALKRYAPQLKQLRVAGERPDSRFPVNYDAGINATLPHLQYFQSATRIYVLRLAAHLALGDSPAAYEDFHAGLRLYTALEKEPTLIAGLVRLSILAFEENAFGSGLLRQQWGDAELAKIIADLSRLRLMDDYAFGLGSERGLSNLVHEQFLGKDARAMADLLFGMHGIEPKVSKRLGSSLVYAFPVLYPRGWIRLSQVYANRYFDEMLARVTQDPPRVHTERPGPSLLPAMAEAGVWDRMRYVLFLGFAPVLSNVERAYAYGQTVLDETRLGCALERERLAHGSYPASLDLLAPTYLPTLPPDVMTGEPLHYRLEAGGGYTLYSVGWNLQDDGGQVNAEGSGRRQPDWVWSIRRDSEQK